MTGKEKCNILREVRRAIAERNGIEFLSAECNNEKDCLGTCPKCEAEVRYLEAELKRKEKNGESVAIDGIFDALHDTFLGQEDFIDRYEVSGNIISKNLLSRFENSPSMCGDLQEIYEDEDEE